MSNLVEEAIQNATLDVFSTMIGVDVCKEENPQPLPLPRVVSSFQLSGAVYATAVMCCPPDLACQIGSSLLQSEYATVDADVLDATGEVANMVVGNVKNALENNWGAIRMSTPSVQHEAEKPADELPPDVTVVFACGSERFSVTVSFGKEGEAPVDHGKTSIQSSGAPA